MKKSSTQPLGVISFTKFFLLRTSRAIRQKLMKGSHREKPRPFAPLICQPEMPGVIGWQVAAVHIIV
jgi:hypothetical protein